MAQQGVASILAVALVLVAFASFPAVHSIGVCNGVIGNNLPAPSDVVKLYQTKGIDAMRIYAPESNVLKALSGTGISLLMDVGNGALTSLANDPSAAPAWVKANVQPFPGVSFRYIAVGNEVTDSAGQKTILPAIKNIQTALAAAGLSGSIKVSTSLRFDVVNNTSPPSNGVFADTSFMGPILDFLASTGAPLLVNVYPYFAYKGDQQNIKLDFATFVPGSTTVTDNGLTYSNLFDAMVDSIYAALEKAGKPDVKVVISESGWPSAGGVGATAQNARAYNQGLINHVRGGTPKKPSLLETYIFAMFNENQKTGDPTENNFGLFNPDKSPAYSVTFYPLPRVHSIGVCNGVIGNNLPAPSDVVKLYKSKGINAMRIYAPESNVLKALSGTGIGLLMDVGNGALPGLANDPSAAAAWVKANVQPYPGVSFRYIAVGNEVMDSDGQKTILPAMKNLQGALAAAGLGGRVKVSTSVRFDVVTDTFPPSNGVFADLDYMGPILDFLVSTGAPLLVNVYPYFAYKGDPQNINLNYATFAPGTTVNDDGNGLTYTNLFDAMVDSIYAALEDAETPGVKVVVSESGWPSAGGFGATAQNAQAYNQGLIKHVGGGTPKRPGPLETYMFAMFNENQKTGDPTENHFGLFNPDKSPAYSISF
ncbi:glucan endo-1,3-beta-glucosidase GIII isoform X2 [Triticum aestivum]|nr:glucan endo-1,3-beta-glucosidase GIII-like isoform X2 [Triticum aestivum]